jgi:hypothetical protein
MSLPPRRPAHDQFVMRGAQAAYTKTGRQRRGEDPLRIARVKARNRSKRERQLQMLRVHHVPMLE